MMGLEPTTFCMASRRSSQLSYIRTSQHYRRVGGVAHPDLPATELEVLHGATLADVPTTRPRHTITETPPVNEALEELRAKLDGGRIDFAELVVLGARAKARQLPDDAQAAREARMRLADMIRGRSVPVDVQAADEVKRRGLIASYDE
jgi:hypothetical protein